MKILLTLFLIFNFNLFSQEIKDTKTVKDSTVIEEITKDTSVVRDSVAILEGAKEIVLPLQIEAFYDGSTFLNRSRIIKSDYNSAYDIINLFPNSYFADKGSIGQYSDVFVYSYNNNSEFTALNSLNLANLYLIQIEGIDSIEILPLPRGFLHNNEPFLQPKFLNFIESDFVSNVPYTRIKYIESSYEGGYVDVILNTLLRKDLNLFVNITNQKTEGRYQNNESSNWMATARLKYFFNENLNLIGSYQYSDLKNNINGGVNIDSLMTILNGEELMYDEVFAPVYYEGFDNIRSHRFSLRSLFKPSSSFKTDLNIYYNFFQNNRRIFSEYKTKLYDLGLNLFQNLDLNVADLKLFLNYKSFDLEADEFNSYMNRKNEYLDLGASLQKSFLDSSIFPSIFLKYSLLNKHKSLNGIGADVLVKLKNFHLYSGFSWDNDFNSEVNIKYFKNDFGIRTYFTYSKFDENKILYGDYLTTIGTDIYYNYKFLLFELNGGYFIDKTENSFLPNIKANTGAYYKGILFNNNLNLKTGFTLYYYNFDKDFYAQKESIFRLDFNLNGTIQESATIYFTMENLLDVKYYLTPYYPMPDRTYRLGVAWEIFN